MLDDVLLVIAALARGDRIDAELVEIHGMVLPDAEAPGGPFAVGNDEVDALFLPGFSGGAPSRPKRRTSRQSLR